MRATAVLACAACYGLAFGLDLSSLSNSEASAGLRKALEQGIGRAVGKLGAPGGFLDNPAVKIPLPPKLAKAEGAMRMLGMGSEADELVTAMNRAAESAVPESKPLLLHALEHMSVSDAKQILTGGDDAGAPGAQRPAAPPRIIRRAARAAPRTRLRL